VTEEAKKTKPQKKRRPDDEIAAEKAAWLLRHNWKGVKRALELVSEASEALEEAHAACNGKVEAAAPMWKTAQNVLGSINAEIGKALPPEAG
jgi:hypothetical protein